MFLGLKMGKLVSTWFSLFLAFKKPKEDIPPGADLKNT